MDKEKYTHKDKDGILTILDKKLFTVSKSLDKTFLFTFLITSLKMTMTITRKMTSLALVVTYMTILDK